MSKLEFYGSDLAKVHNDYYSDFIKAIGSPLVKILKETKCPSSIVLDLGCGGGQLSKYLSRAGLNTWGLDVSKPMIRLAKRNYPKGQFQCGSLESVRLPNCGAAVAAGEVLNYLPSKSAILSVLKNVHKNLISGGIFIFDVRIRNRQQSGGVREHVRLGDDWAIYVKDQFRRLGSILVREIDLFYQISSKRYRRSKEVHKQQLLSVGDVRTLLKQVGFKVAVLQSYGAHRLPKTHRVFLAEKK